MGWFDHNDFIRVDPDHRQNRGNGPVIIISISRDEIYARWGPLNPVRRTRTGFILSDSDIVRVSKRRRAKRK